MPNKQFNSDQIQKIILRASKLKENEERHVSDMDNGLSLEELKEIGNEAGLDPRFIEAAAAEYSGSIRKRFSGFSETHIFEEREVDVPITEIDWDVVSSELIHYFGKSFGKVDENPKKREWSHTSASGIESRVSISGNSEAYKLRLSQRVGLASTLTEGIMYGTTAAVLLGLILSGTMSLSGFEKIFTFTSLSVGFSALTYALDKAWRRKKLRGLSMLADKIVDAIRFGEPSEPEANAFKKQKITPLLDEVDSDEDTLPSSRSRTKSKS